MHVCVGACALVCLLLCTHIYLMYVGRHTWMHVARVLWWWFGTGAGDLVFPILHGDTLFAS